MPIRIKLFLLILFISVTPILLIFFMVPQLSEILFTNSGTYLLMILFVVIILITLYSIFVAIQFCLPLTTLGEIASKARKGILSDRVYIDNAHTKDEIGDLATSFNAMLDALQNQQSNLQKTVAKATNELNDKVEELEKANKLMIGRELKMIELKKQIKALTKNNHE